MRCRTLVLVFLFTMSMFLVDGAEATPGWNKYYILQAGSSEEGDITIKLMDVDGNDNWCYVKSGAAKTVLAVALTALTSNMPVRAYVDFDAMIYNRVIFGMYLLGE